MALDLDMGVDLDVDSKLYYGLYNLVRLVISSINIIIIYLIYFILFFVEMNIPDKNELMKEIGTMISQLLCFFLFLYENFRSILKYIYIYICVYSFS